MVSGPFLGGCGVGRRRYLCVSPSGAGAKLSERRRRWCWAYGEAGSVAVGATPAARPARSCEWRAPPLMPSSWRGRRKLEVSCATVDAERAARPGTSRRAVDAALVMAGRKRLWLWLW